MTARIEPAYRSKTYDDRAVTGLKHAEISDMVDGAPRFYSTPSANSMIRQDHTPRRARMRAGVVEHVSRWGHVTAYRIVEVMRTESFGPGPTLYGWRAAGAVEVTL